MEKHPYAIQFRMRGKPRDIIREKAFEIYKQFGLGSAINRRFVPHVLLFGPFQTNSIPDVVRVISEIGSGYEAMYYQMNGYISVDKYSGTFLTLKKRKKALAVKITPSEEVVKLRKEISNRLLDITKPANRRTEKSDEYKFYAKITQGEIDAKFGEIWDFLKTQPVSLPGMFYRITLLGYNRIVYEYDLVQKRLLNRHQALSGRLWKDTYMMSQQQKNTQRPLDAASTIAFYECPDCHNPNIQNMPDGSALCSTCGFTS